MNRRAPGFTSQLDPLAALRESEARFREIANAAPTLIWMAGTDGSATFFNEQWLAFTGRTMEQEHGVGWVHSVHPDDVIRYRAVYRAALAARETFEIEFRLRHANGEYRWLLGRGNPIFHDGGRFGGMAGSCIDISERRRTDEAMRLLADVSAELSASLEPERAFSALCEILVPRFADWCTVSILEPAGGICHRALRHRDPGGQRILEDLDALIPARVGGPGIVARVIATGGHAFVSDVQFYDGANSDPGIDPLRRLNFGSGLAVALVGRGRTLGALSLGRRSSSPRFEQADLALALEVARRAALAIDNAELYSEARRIEADLRRSNEVIRFVADASSAVADSLDYEEALQKVAELAVPRFADCCAVDILEPGEALKRVSVVHRDDTMVALVNELAQRYPPDLSAGNGIAQLLRTGNSMLYPEISEAALSDLALDIGHLALLQRFAPKSVMAVALSSRGRIFGALTFVINQGTHRYTEADLSMAEQLARRAGVAIENARLYTEAQQRERELVRANEAKDEFLGLMSHELRTPITVIHGGAQVLKARGSTLDEESRQGMLGDIERESERLVRMLENLLALARLELDQEPDVEPVLAQRVIARIVESVRKPGGRRPVEVNAEPGLPAVAADPAYLEHVVRNLISNADKYSPPGLPVEVRVSRGDGHAEVRVMDRGLGIAPDESDRIFERFYRSDRTAKLAGGAGMGLAVCKRLIESMGGEIWARPRKGGGLEAGFSLPFYLEDEL